MNKPHLNENGEWRCEVVHHMGRRLPGWDYRRVAIYVLTLVVEDRSRQPLGEIWVKRPAAHAAGAGRTAGAVGAEGWGGAVGAEGQGGAVGAADVGGGAWVRLDEAKGLGLAPDEVEARCVFSELGRAVFAHFRGLSMFVPEVDPLYCEIMPDHLHMVLYVRRELKRPLGQVVAGFKAGCEKLAAKLGYGARLWAEGFVDQIVFRQGQLAAEFAYLHDNPRRRAVKRLFPGLFRRVAQLKVNLRLTPQGPNGQAGAKSAAGTAGFGGGSGVGGAAARPAPAASAVGYFEALGNRFLLDRPLTQVQVSRSYFRYRREPKPGGGLKIARDAAGEPLVELSTTEYEARREELLTAAKRGAVLISPCVSDGERQIAREALKAGAKLVTLQNKGFAPLEKPGGRYFDACAEGRLLMLAPAAWPYQPNEKPMTRFDATALNRLGQWLAGDGAAEINYRGMKPANIDELALAAVASRQAMCYRK